MSNKAINKRANNVLKIYSVISTIAIIMLIICITGAGTKITNLFNKIEYKKVASLGELSKDNNDLSAYYYTSGFTVTSKGYVYSNSGKLYFYSKLSKLIKIVDIPEGTVGFGLISNEDDIVIALARDSSRMYGFNLDGEKLWQNDLPSNLHVNTIFNDNSLGGTLIGTFKDKISLHDSLRNVTFSLTSFGGEDVIRIDYEVDDKGVSFEVESAQQIGGEDDDYPYTPYTVYDNDSTRNDFLVLSLTGEVSSKTLYFSESTVENGKTLQERLNERQKSLFTSVDRDIYLVYDSGNDDFPWIKLANRTQSITYGSKSDDSVFVLSNAGDTEYVREDANGEIIKADNGGDFAIRKYDTEGRLLESKLIKNMDDDTFNEGLSTIYKLKNHIYVLATEGSADTNVIMLDDDLNAIGDEISLPFRALGACEKDGTMYIVGTEDGEKVVIYQFS